MYIHECISNSPYCCTTVANFNHHSLLLLLLSSSSSSSFSFSSFSFSFSSSSSLIITNASSPSSQLPRLSRYDRCDVPLSVLAENVFAALHDEYVAREKEYLKGQLDAFAERVKAEIKEAKEKNTFIVCNQTKKDLFLCFITACLHICHFCSQKFSFFSFHFFTLFPSHSSLSLSFIHSFIQYLIHTCTHLYIIIHPYSNISSHISPHFPSQYKVRVLLAPAGTPAPPGDALGDCVMGVSIDNVSVVVDGWLNESTIDWLIDWLDGWMDG